MRTKKKQRQKASIAAIATTTRHTELQIKEEYLEGIDADEVNIPLSRKGGTRPEGEKQF